MLILAILLAAAYLVYVWVVYLAYLWAERRVIVDDKYLRALRRVCE